MEQLLHKLLTNIRKAQIVCSVEAVLKRMADIVISLIMLIVLSPLMIVAVIGVKCSSPGPVFFKQNRIGKNEVPYTMYKFRSMVMNDSEETGWTVPEDDRITVFGSFLRKYSIDELPQLLNVLKGDMSLVGPRPEIPYYVRKFEQDIPSYFVRQKVRPGITGWAQVNGLRGDTSIEVRVKYDIWYIEHWSLWLDLKILFMTVFKGKFVNQVEIRKKVKVKH